MRVVRAPHAKLPMILFKLNPKTRAKLIQTQRTIDFTTNYCYLIHTLRDHYHCDTSRKYCNGDHMTIEAADGCARSWKEEQKFIEEIKQSQKRKQNE